MGDLISRSALIEALHQKKSVMVAEPDGKHSVSLETVIDYIGKYPTVDAVPVFHAEWEQLCDPYFSTKIPTISRCTACGKKYNLGHLDYNFCPNCGADMRKKVQE